MAFVHLGIHSEYSITDSIVRIKPLIKAAAADDQRALALTDLSNLYATVKFYRACLGAGIKPIIGSEIIMDNEDTRLVLLAMDNEGYQNITRIVSLGFTEGRADVANHGVPVVERRHVLEHAAGVIVLFTEKSDVGQALVSSMPEKADELLTEWQAQFDDRLYFAIKRTNRSGEDAFIKAAIHSGAKHRIPIIAHNDVRFLEQDDFDAHEARVCIAGSYVLADPNRPRLYSDEQYLKTQAQMAQLFADIPQVIENTLCLATRCNVTLTLGINVLPEFPVPEGETIESFFRAESIRGLNHRLDKLFPIEARTDNWSDFRQKYDERLEYELEVILSMGFPGYFLIVMDFIRWAKANGVPVGPGRGSGAGSLVAYALNITDLDPIHYDLLFERFLNPERVSMPDFDIDFCIEGRDRVIDYVAQTYGREAVSQIITFGTMAAKGVIRDVGRVMDLPYAYVDSLAKMIPNELNITIERALQINPELRKMYETDPQVHELIDMSKRLEGLPRHTSMHAAGVVICSRPAEELVPLSRGSDGSITTQFTMTTIEELGLLKMDFLGLRTLTVLRDAVKLIEKSQGIHIDIDHIDFDDKKVLASIGTGRTDGVFQLESGGMKNFMKELRPENLEDIIAGISLYRP
ncbi:DNA polymerase III subunit alpha, partial [uncultured Psychrobacter sp.]|uniref:DNA polymerase III subunit alpha n=1 Tax=uncultured Psychrobacter sp. TaxID=259303 RepID=UPI002639EC0B